MALHDVTSPNDGCFMPIQLVIRAQSGDRLLVLIVSRKRVFVCFLLTSSISAGIESAMLRQMVLVKLTLSSLKLILDNMPLCLHFCWLCTVR